MKPRPFVSFAGVALLAIANVPAFAATNLSTWVFPGPSGRILQQPDALGNRVLDYTAVGYKGGTVPIPEVPVKVTGSAATVSGTTHNITNTYVSVGACSINVDSTSGLAVGDQRV